MHSKSFLNVSPRVRVILLTGSFILILFLVGCGAGDGVSMTGGTEADQAAILAAVDTDLFFDDSLTGTDEDEVAAASAQAEVYVSGGGVTLSGLGGRSTSTSRAASQT